MYLKYQVYNEEENSIVEEIAEFKNITYRKEFDICVIQLRGFEDIVLFMTYSKYEFFLNSLYHKLDTHNSAEIIGLTVNIHDNDYKFNLEEYRNNGEALYKKLYNNNMHYNYTLS